MAIDSDVIIGYLAASVSILAFGSQFIHTIKTKTTAGLSLQRSALDSISLALWLGYAARVDDIPLLAATTVELCTSVALIVIIVRARVHVFSAVKDYTPPATPPMDPTAPEHAVIEIRPARRASV